MFSVKDDIKNLLVLQERDIKLRDIKLKLEAIPAEIAALNSKIDAEKSAIGEYLRAIKDKELARAALRGERKDVEDKIFKYKARLSIVKKNDEYTAINEAIDKCNLQVSALEEKELEILFSIDEMTPKLDAQKLAIQKKIDEVNLQIKQLEDNKKMLEGDLENAAFARRQAEKGISEIFLAAYERILNSKKRFPIVSYIEDSKCSGCHLKISADLEDFAKTCDRPIFCEHCGRIIYVYA